MSKDKGNKNKKKAKAEKNTGKKKVVSAYKSEGTKSDPSLDALKPKSDGDHKKKK